MKEGIKEKYQSAFAKESRSLSFGVIGLADLSWFLAIFASWGGIFRIIAAHSKRSARGDGTFQQRHRRPLLPMCTVDLRRSPRRWVARDSGSEVIFNLAFL